ncbi:hypothetical protein PIB30_004134 [Stylosanthes scabra]|uniref:Uncharacterized protein n=1 Tax=Stylosanthes scabra TaxID=79078 RepID=A0ABU6Q3F3_9FABA|nr:hypothetical protein [Stylosanthes scabra]
MSSPSQQAFLDGLSSPTFQNFISGVLHEGDGGYRPDTQFDGSQVHVDLNEPLSGPSHLFMALGGTPPSAAHVPGGSWDIPFTEPARLPTPQRHLHQLSNLTSQQHWDGPAKLQVVEGAAPEAICSFLMLFMKATTYMTWDGNLTSPASSRPAGYLGRLHGYGTGMGIERPAPLSAPPRPIFVYI